MVNLKKVLQASVTLLALLLLIFVSAIISLKVATWGRTVEVPDIVGKDLADAVNILGHEGLEINVERQEYHQSIPVNHVTYQDPQPGTSVKKGRGVAVAVSLGSMEVTAPRLVAEPLKRAQILLSGAGLVTGELTRIYSDAPRDSILAQYPDEGTVLQKGVQVNLLVSEGARPVEFVMTDVTGGTLAQAEAVARPLAVKVMPSGKGSVVVSQNPPFGQPLKAGGTLHVTLGTTRSAVTPSTPAAPAPPAATTAPAAAAQKPAAQPAQPAVTPAPPQPAPKPAAQPAASTAPTPKPPLPSNAVKTDDKGNIR